MTWQEIRAERLRLREECKRLDAFIAVLKSPIGDWRVLYGTEQSRKTPAGSV